MIMIKMIIWVMDDVDYGDRNHVEDNYKTTTMTAMINDIDDRS